MGNRNIPRIFGNATQIFDVMAVMTYDPWLAVVYLPFFYPLNGRSSGSNSLSYCGTVVRTICLAGNFQQHIFWGYPLTYSTNTKMEFQVFWYVWPYFLGIFPEKKIGLKNIGRTSARWHGSTEMNDPSELRPACLLWLPPRPAHSQGHASNLRFWRGNHASNWGIPYIQYIPIYPIYIYIFILYNCICVYLYNL